MFTKQPTMDMDIEFDIKLLATEYYEGTVGIIHIYIYIRYIAMYTANQVYASSPSLRLSILPRSNFLPAQTK